MVVRDQKIQMLTRFIRRSGADASRPASHRLRSRIFEDGLIWPGQEAWGIVYCHDADLESLGSRSITSPIGGAAVIMQSQRHDSGPVEINRRSVAESTVHGD